MSFAGGLGLEASPAICDKRMLDVMKCKLRARCELVLILDAHPNVQMRHVHACEVYCLA